VPVTDECAPDQDDFNQFVELLREGGLGAAYIFNCQMGRGRTTTGMVCAYMFQYFHALHFEMQDVIDEHEKSVQLKRDSSSFNLNATTLKYIEGNYK
jgi:protein-tyrosine phosphatase